MIKFKIVLKKKVSSKEYPEWLNGHSDLMPSLETLKSWKKIGQV